MDVCIACGCTSTVFALEKNSCRIVRCSDCGLGKTSEIAKFDANSYYSESYFQGGVSDGYADYLGSEDTLRTEFRAIVSAMMALDCRPGRLLEFGCAYGFFLQEAKPYFENVHGIEVAEHPVRFCQSQGLDVARGVVDNSSLKGFYDVVVGLDVIEHLSEPGETLKQIGSHMNTGGILLMTTGDWSAPLARFTGARWRLMTPPQHLFFFTPKSMRLLLEKAGFQIFSVSHPWKRVPLSLIAYQLQRMVGLRPRSVSLFDGLWFPVNLGDAMRVVAKKL